VVAIAEPRTQTRALFATQYGVDDSLVFETWEQFHKASAESIQTAGKRLADAVIVAVQDNMHVELVEAFAAQGYDILCEKPMATSIEHCLQIEAAVKRAGIIFGLGHGMPPIPRMSSSHNDQSKRVSAAVLAIFSCRNPSRTIREARSTCECPAYRARRSLALCTLLCPWKLVKGERKQLLFDDQELPVRPRSLLDQNAED
jgi:Oxidoreductase family, NAD-binding Rossmann fold